MIPTLEQNEAQTQAKLKAQKIANAFHAVFGEPDKRTSDQKTVIEHLAVCAGDDGNSYRFHEAKDGISLIAAGLHRDGAKSLLRVIEFQVAKAQTQAADKPKPKTKR